MEAQSWELKRLVAKSEKRVYNIEVETKKMQQATTSRFAQMEEALAELKANNRRSISADLRSEAAETQN